MNSRMFHITIKSCGKPVGAHSARVRKDIAEKETKQDHRIIEYPVKTSDNIKAPK